MPESLGKTLQRIRESKHLSIKDVSEKTRIPSKHIFAIEEDRLDKIASVVYAKGFVKSYAQVLGALEEKVVREYLGSAKKGDEPTLVIEKKKAALPADWLIRRKKDIGVGVLVLVAVWAVLFSFSQAKKFVKNVSVRYRAQAVRKQEAKKEILVSQTIPLSESKKVEGVKLDIIAHSDTWAQLISDGELLFRGILKKGTSDTWQAKREIRLELGNAGGVTLKLNDENIGSPGRKGEKKEIVITREGIQ